MKINQKDDSNETGRSVLISGGSGFIGRYLTSLLLAEVMKRPVILPPVPGWIMRTLMGEMSDIILEGSRISSEKIIGSGFSFQFKSAREALENIIGS